MFPSLGRRTNDLSPLYGLAQVCVQDSLSSRDIVHTIFISSVIEEFDHSSRKNRLKCFMEAKTTKALSNWP